MLKSWGLLPRVRLVGLFRYGPIFFSSRTRIAFPLNERIRTMRIKRNFETTVCPDERHRPEWESWRAAWIRCTYPSQKYFYNYGGRGITVCEAWKSFETFLRDMKEKPEPKKSYSLDRKKNELGYCPDNCRWATRKEQAANRRPNLNARNTHCFRGHLLIPENLISRMRRCRLCANLRARARRMENKPKNARP